MWLLVIYLFLFLIIWLVVIVMKESDVSSEPRCKLIRICFFSFFFFPKELMIMLREKNVIL